jgi:hypothetical protein
MNKLINLNEALTASECRLVLNRLHKTETELIAFLTSERLKTPYELVREAMLAEVADPYGSRLTSMDFNGNMRAKILDYHCFSDAPRTPMDTIKHFGVYASALVTKWFDAVKDVIKTKYGLDLDQIQQIPDKDSWALELCEQSCNGKTSNKLQALFTKRKELLERAKQYAELLTDEMKTD